jgi:hypothetical protein
MSGMGVKITEHFYTEARLGQLLQVDRSTLYRWRQRGLLNHYGHGKAVLYGESHIRQYFSSFENIESDRIEGWLACMRDGHSPAGFESIFSCPRSHYLTVKQCMLVFTSPALFNRIVFEKCGAPGVDFNNMLQEFADGRR